MNTSTDEFDIELFYELLEHKVITDRSLAIDGGAHLGSWTFEMAKFFDQVVAFEPTLETFSRFAEEARMSRNIDGYRAALMDENCLVNVCQTRPKRVRLTARYCMKAEDGEVAAIALDNMHLESCGFIKLDLEGAEPLALAGARDTIIRCRPVMVIEIGGLSERYGVAPEDVHQQVLDLDYRELYRRGVNRVFIPRR